MQKFSILIKQEALVKLDPIHYRLKDIEVNFFERLCFEKSHDDTLFLGLQNFTNSIIQKVSAATIGGLSTAESASRHLFHPGGARVVSMEGATVLWGHTGFHCNVSGGLGDHGLCL